MTTDSPTKVDHKQLRERLCYLLLLSLGFTMIAMFAALLWYAIPPPGDVYVGKLADFPVADAPYRFLLPDERPVFIINDGKAIYALDGIGTHLFHCRLIWRKPAPHITETDGKARFEDPCAGGSFALNGGYQFGPSPIHMDRFKLRIDALNRVYVDPQVRLSESREEYFTRCYEAQIEPNRRSEFNSKLRCERYTDYYFSNGAISGW